MLVHIRRSERWLGAVLALTAATVVVAAYPKRSGDNPPGVWQRTVSAANWSRAGNSATRALMIKGGAPVYD